MKNITCFHVNPSRGKINEPESSLLAKKVTKEVQKCVTVQLEMKTSNRVLQMLFSFAVVVGVSR